MRAIDGKGPWGLPRIVWLLGVASLFNDVSSEAIFPLLPLFLAGLPGGGIRVLGLVEGAADAVASAAKVVAGRISDRGPRRLLVVGGYALPAAARAGIAAAALPWHVLGARLLDRLGKGIRSGPRDALLADAAAAGDVGRAFGLQRSMDHFGAAVGPLLASGLLAAGTSVRTTFAVAAAAGLAAPAVLAWRLREPSAPLTPALSPRSAGGEGEASSTRSQRSFIPSPSTPGLLRRPYAQGERSRGTTSTSTSTPIAIAIAAQPARLPPAFWRYLTAATVFALGNSSDAFLLARARDVGFSPAAVPLLWFGHHVVKTLAGLPGGALSDRLPRRAVVAAGWAAYALAYAGFALATARWQIAALFGFYALYHGLAEGAERALVADLADAAARGRAYGWYHGAAGAAALPAGLLTGWLWARRGPAVALGTCAAFAAIAAVLLVLAVGARDRRVAAGPRVLDP